MTDTYRSDPIFVSAFTAFEGYHERERIVEGTALDVIKRESSKFFALVENTLLKNMLNDPYVRSFTIFVPVNFDLDIFGKYHAELLVSHAMAPYIFIPYGKDVVLEMMDQHVCRVRKDLIDGKKILSSIQCSNGIVHLIEDILEPSLLKGVY
jgi:uncharacterized surface protein with fasciclin (FAS1) repeats